MRNVWRCVKKCFDVNTGADPASKVRGGDFSKIW